MATTVVVLGSVHHDRTRYVAELPGAGETVIAIDSSEGLGGKGANQAAAVALQGGRGILVGAVGVDASAEFVRTELRRLGVDDDHVSSIEAARTGSASITVDQAGENVIVVESGANRSVTGADLPDPVALPGHPDVVLAQGELGSRAVQGAADYAERLRARFVLNLAPVVSVGSTVIGRADPVVVNQSEAIALAEQIGLPRATPDVSADPVAWAMTLAIALVETVATSAVITLGALGAVGATASGCWHEPAFATTVIETTGAGDCFTGTLALALAEGSSLRAATIRGLAAASVAVSRAGTAAGYPIRSEIDDVLQRQAGARS